jgi:hypothetical protein
MHAAPTPIFDGNSTTHMTVSAAGFRAWLSSDSLNGRLLWIAGSATLIEFIIFKLCYPYAGFINGDSYAYLASAYYNSDINTYPIGYSKFLRVFSTFTRSDTALVAFQYFAIEASAFWLLYTLTNIFHPRRLTKAILLVFVVCNPVFLYISNYVSSDAIFLAISLIWFTLLLKIIRSPTTKLLIYQSIILLLAFVVRYNALYYPLIAALALLLTPLPLRAKLLAISANFLLIGLFIAYQSDRYYKVTGIRQFTPFSGWQLANNALYAYRYVDSAEVKPPPSEFKTLDRAVRHYFDTTRDTNRHPEEMIQASTVYMWDAHSPLQQFLRAQTKADTIASSLKRWALMGPLYGDYGCYLIRRYPGVYFNYYLLPNALKYYVPPGEFLFQYNMGQDTVAAIAASWFRYPSQKVKPAVGGFDVHLLDFMSVFAALANIVFLLSSVGLAFLSGPQAHAIRRPALVLAVALWIANFGFSVFASPITLRYQLFGFLVFSSFACLLIDNIHKLAFSTEPSILDSAPGSDPTVDR